jgi:hypothetical protein
MNQLERARSVFVPKLRHVAHFLTKQGLATAGNLLYGLVCVRLLPVTEYAKFAVLFGFMGSLTILLDIGVTSTLTPLVGEQIDNLQLIADYVASIRKLMQRLYIVVAPIAAIIFVLLVQKRHWGVWVEAQMLVALLVTAWFARVSSSYSLVLILRRDRSRYYHLQMAGSLGSLALLLLFSAFGHLNIYVAILLNVAQVVFLAASNYRRALELLGVQGVSSRRQERAVVRLAMPNLPNIIFYAVQGQITLMLITIFGRDSVSVANVGALARLGQILVLISQMNPILIEPFFAKLSASRLLRNYLLVGALAVTGAFLLSVVAFVFPGVLLWILGPKYGNLRFEVGLQILITAIAYVSGLLWVIHTSRRFIYWWHNFANIILTIAVQVAFLWKFDLSTVRNVLIMNVASAVVSLVVNVACGIYGFWRGPQKLEQPDLHESLESEV